MKHHFTKNFFTFYHTKPKCKRIKFLFMLLFGLLVNMNLYAQGNITLDRENTPIRDVFSEIEQKSSLVFIYSGKLDTELNKRITIKAVSEPLKELLSRIIKNTRLKYRILDKQVVIYKEEAESTKKDNASVVSDNQTAPSTPLSIKGTVTDRKGEPLTGVNIRIKGTTTGLISNVKGYFEVTLQGMKTAHWYFLP